MRPSGGAESGPSAAAGRVTLVFVPPMNSARDSSRAPNIVVIHRADAIDPNNRFYQSSRMVDRRRRKNLSGCGWRSPLNEPELGLQYLRGNNLLTLSRTV